MTETSAEIDDIVIDCSIPAVVAGFWASLLGRPITGRRGPYVWLQSPAAEAGLGFQRVREEKIGKNRVHLDIAGVGNGALEDRSERLGGRKITGTRTGAFSSWQTQKDMSSASFLQGPSNSAIKDRPHYQDGAEA